MRKICTAQLQAKMSHSVWLFHTHFRVLVMLIIEDPTVKCSTAIKMLYYKL